MNTATNDEAMDSKKMWAVLKRLRAKSACKARSTLVPDNSHLSTVLFPEEIEDL
jgi:hypothetical protein